MFPDKDTANDYMKRHCASFDYQECTVAKALTEYYDGVNK